MIGRSFAWIQQYSVGSGVGRLRRHADVQGAAGPPGSSSQASPLLLSRLSNYPESARGSGAFSLLLAISGDGVIRIIPVDSKTCPAVSSGDSRGRRSERRVGVTFVSGTASALRGGILGPELDPPARHPATPVLPPKLATGRLPAAPQGRNYPEYLPSGTCAEQGKGQAQPLKSG